MTAKKVGRSRRDGTVRALTVDVGGEREGHTHAPRAINRLVASRRKVQRRRGCDAQPGLMTYLRRKGLYE
jgi:hypothetical protein